MFAVRRATVRRPRGRLHTDTIMRELFRERDPALVGMYQSLLEAAGIPTHVRNRDLVVMMTEVPIPEFFPALCVVNDDDYDRALSILRKSRGVDADVGGQAAAGTTDVPFETRGIILAGVVLFCALVLLGGAAIMAALLSEPDPGMAVIAVCAALMVGAVLIAARTTRAYLATRKRAARES